MIDPKTETLLPLSQVPGLLPPSLRTGRPLTRQLIYHWVKVGRAGGAKLETITMKMTTVEAVQRFLDGPVEPPEAPSVDDAAVPHEAMERGDDPAAVRREVPTVIA